MPPQNARMTTITTPETREMEALMTEASCAARALAQTDDTDRGANNHQTTDAEERDGQEAFLSARRGGRRRGRRLLLILRFELAFGPNDFTVVDAGLRRQCGRQK